MITDADAHAAFAKWTGTRMLFLLSRVAVSHDVSFCFLIDAPLPESQDVGQDGLAFVARRMPIPKGDEAQADSKSSDDDDDGASDDGQPAATQALSRFSLQQSRSRAFAAAQTKSVAVQRACAPRIMMPLPQSYELPPCPFRVACSRAPQHLSIHTVTRCLLRLCLQDCSETRNGWFLSSLVSRSLAR